METGSQFAFKLYRQLVNDAADANLFFSPFSIFAVLCMALEGARGHTADEMGRMLSIASGAAGGQSGWDTASVHSQIARLMDSLKIAENDPRLVEKRKRADVMRAEHQELEERKQRIEQKFESEAFWKLDKSEQTATFTEQERVLNDSQKVARGLNELLDQIDPYELAIANALWGERSCPFRRAFVDRLTKYYGTDGVVVCDFASNCEAERRRINAWVEDRTKDRIKELLAEGMLDPLTRLVLVNAIYFKGNWAEPFAETETREGGFLGIDGQTISVAMMRNRSVSGCRYAAFNADGSLFQTPLKVSTTDTQTEDKYPDPAGFQIVELPYRGHEISMVIFLPARKDGLAALEQTLSAQVVERWIDQLEERVVDTALPRFRGETGYELNAALQALGMRTAFEGPAATGGADFSAMTESKELIDQIFISLVIHKAFVEVNEQGTEAAAATAIDMVGLGIPEYVDFVPEFHADHAFVYIIRHRESNTILFMGRMLAPKR
jgi:serine protease inhibitor